MRNLLLPAALLLFEACNDDGLLVRTTSSDLPRRESFDAVGSLLVASCGSLDCHGAAPRSFRLRGFGGRRLAPEHTPDDPATTAAELSFDYDLTVSVEPELVRRVARAEVTPEILTLVRKARGTEAHVGGGLMPTGSAADRCLVAWLARHDDPAVCAAALSPIADAGVGP